VVSRRGSIEQPRYSGCAVYVIVGGLHGSNPTMKRRLFYLIILLSIGIQLKAQQITPTPTPRPANADELRALFGEGCKLPCYLGIEIGETNSVELLPKLQPLGYQWAHGADILDGAISWRMPPQRFVTDFRSSAAYLNFHQAIVWFFWAPINASLDAIIAVFGFPDEITRLTNSTTEFIYPQYGLVFWFSNDANISSYIRAYPPYADYMRVGEPIGRCTSFGTPPCLVPTATYDPNRILPTPTQTPLPTLEFEPTRTPTPVPVLIEDPIIAIHWSATAKHVAQIHQSGEMVVIREDETRLSLNTGKPVSDVAWSPSDERILAVAFERAYTLIFDVDAASIRYEIHSNRHEGPLSIDFSPDGTKLAIGNDGLSDGSGSIELYDAETGEMIFVSPENYPQGVRDIAWSPDGQMIAGRVWDAQAARFVVQLWNTEGEPLNRLSTAERQAGSIQNFAWSPDSSMLVTSAGYDVTFWRTDTFEQIKTFENANFIHELDWSPEGRYVSFLERQITGIQFYDVLTGELTTNAYYDFDWGWSNIAFGVLLTTHEWRSTDGDIGYAFAHRYYDFNQANTIHLLDRKRTPVPPTVTP
jgi:WD40 repeat protein